MNAPSDPTPPTQPQVLAGIDQIDYRETGDITQQHSAIERREHSVGTPGSVPVPIWLMSVCGVALFWAGAYLGMFSGGFSAEVYNPLEGSAKLFATTSTKAAGGPGGEQQADSPVAQGKRFFTQNCVSCHQSSGLGVAGQYPPLAKSEYVNGTPKRLAMILLKGLQGPVTVGGVNFNNAMPAWEKTLADKKIAAILTYVRQDWGNTAGEITPEQIAAARKEFAARGEPWSEGDLKAIPEDATLPGGKEGNAPPAPGGSPSPVQEAKK